MTTQTQAGMFRTPTVKQKRLDERWLGEPGGSVLFDLFF